MFTSLPAWFSCMFCFVCALLCYALYFYFWGDKR